MIAAIDDQPALKAVRADSWSRRDLFLSLKLTSTSRAAGMTLCANAGLLDLRDACVRGTWGALVPSFIVFTLCLLAFHPPLPAPMRRIVDFVKSPFQPFLTLEEAELLLDSIAEVPSKSRHVAPWRPLLVGFGLAESVAWIGVAAFSFATNAAVWQGVRELLISLTWMYTVGRAIVHLSATPPYDLFMLYIVYLCAGTLQIVGYLFQYSVSGASLPGGLTLFGMCADIGASLTLVSVVLTMPLNVPSSRINPADIVRFFLPFLGCCSPIT